jgi:hypothetical protein
MRDKLAELLLANVLHWGPEDVAKERPDIQALATYRFDQYDQFSPGMKFVESLASWLGQFGTLEERRIAYRFLRERLVFISQSEMTHLVAMAYPSVIRPVLIKEVAKSRNTPEWKVRGIVTSNEFKVLLRKSLFLGLSDGSHTDVFRRANPQISTEQVVRTQEISGARALDIANSLRDDLTRILLREPTTEECRFKIIFLMDDFSASGKTYLRQDSATSEYAGKIAKLYRDIQSDFGTLSRLVNLPDLIIVLILYVTTSQAVVHLQSAGPKLFGAIPFFVKPVYRLGDSIKVTDDKDGPFIGLLKKYYDPLIEDKSYLRGRHDRPYLGFDECSLPVVLSHNTPNNSVTLLWLYEDCDYRGLFPRVSRFRET